MQGLTRAVLALTTTLALPAGAKELPAKGYVAPLDYRTVIGPPPAPGSSQAAADRAAFAKTAAEIGSPRYNYASTQLAPSSKKVMQQLSCAVGHQISLATTPLTMAFIKRIRADIDRPVNAAKSHFARDRPFVGAEDARTCDPRTATKMMPKTPPRPNYSYPSGHAAIGALFGTVFAAAVPGNAVAVREWGEDFGDNRLVCRTHWQSDVTAGRKLADAVYAQLRADPAFNRDLGAVRAELSGAAPAFSC
ncbi:MAG: phosphatase PAP2 family protein [Polymorphobacter sp.]